MAKENLVVYHEKPIFRGNYNLVIGVCFKKPIGSHFSYCSNNKIWAAFVDGNEAGLLTEEGIKYAKSLCNQDVVKNY